VTPNQAVKKKDVRASRRTLIQNAKLAIRDIFDVTTELVTNADDRYQLMGGEGVIQIEIERRRGQPNLYHVRDFADGMTSRVMEEKLSRMGGRVSGFQEGKAVRGTNARGAKDVASLGRVTFRSIAGDGLFHSCEISPFMEFTLYESKPVSKELRKEVGIPRGTGTLVTLEVDQNQPIPHHDNLRQKLERLVSLRDILSDPAREITLRDVNSRHTKTLIAPSIQGTDRVKIQIQIPGYPKAHAKLTIRRAHERFEKDVSRFRRGGILVKSRHAIHESTLFDPGLESDPHARWFYGRLVCKYIDDLSDEFDERFDQGLPPTPDNPRPIIDPSRRSGLTRDHPFVKALTAEVLKRLRPLVEEERRRAEHEQAEIENRATRQRLDRLEKAALKFMERFSDDEARDTSSTSSTSELMRRGYQLSPPFSQILIGHSIRMSLNINQETFPELEVGATVQVDSHDDAIRASKQYAALEPHPGREGIIRATWKVTAEAPSPATGIHIRVGPIAAEAMIEVLGSEADRYRNISSLAFQRKRYQVRIGAKRKKLRLLAPLSLASEPTNVDIQMTGAGRHLTVSGDQTLEPRHDLGVAICEIFVKADENEARGTLTATVGKAKAVAEIVSVLPAGFGIKIKLRDIDLGNQRYRWRQNVLEIAARHQSLARYLGDKAKGFPGQDDIHFRLLLAEIVSDALCAQMLSRDIQNAPEDYEDADWDLFYAEYSKLMTRFLPIAHEVQCPL
jgi:hypothetical protein